MCGESRTHGVERGKSQKAYLSLYIKQIGSQAYVERIARTYLGLFYPNEQIVVPVESKPVEKSATEMTTDVSEPAETVDETVTEETTTDVSEPEEATEEIVQETGQ